MSRGKGISSALKPIIYSVLALILIPFPAQAAEPDDDEVEKVTVTGSRIRKADIEKQSPITILDREDIERTGLKSVGDILQQLPVSGSALNTRFNSSGNFGFPPDGGGIGAGAAEVDLRHLGSNRVLVLVDGVRWVNGSSASGVANAVDLNTIPVSVIERVEVLEDGASSIYGSDAIAGVVNIITRKDYSGFEINAYGGQFDEGDGETASFDISFGAVGDKHSVFFNVSHTDQDGVSAADRSLARFPVPGTGVTHGSSGTPQGRFLFLGNDNDGDGSPDVVDVTINDGVTGIPVFDPNNPGGADFHSFTDNDRFNFSPFNLYVTPSQRTSLYGQAQYEFANNLRVYAKALFNNRQSRNQAAPEPIFIGPDAGTGGLADTVGIHETNPFNPFGMTLDENNLIFIGRRPLEGGPRIFRQDVDTQYLGMGLQGEFYAGNRDFFWDINASWGKNRADQIKTGGYNIRHIKNALGPLDECLAIPGCVPLNLTGGQGNGSGTITPEMLNYIQFVQKDVSENKIRTLSANITGELFQLPAGPLAFAAGAETRELEGFFQPDAVVVAGDSNGVPSLPTSGDYDVDEYYAELNVPLLSDVPFVQQLEVSAAMRLSDYSTFGNETTSKFGILWRVTDDLLLRGTVAEGFRAPSIGELFASASRFDATIADLCSEYQTSGVSSTIIANCMALGVPDTFTQTSGQISVTTGGNQDLEPETADSITYGLVYSPQWVTGYNHVDRFDLEITAYEHEVDDAIQAIDAQTQLNECIRTLDPVFCGGISRAATGGINGFNNRLTNIGKIETSGYDINMNYATPDYNWGRLSVIWRNSFVDDYSETALGQKTSLEGIERNDTGIPEFQSQFIVSWTKANWDVAWSIRYIDELEESCSDFKDGSPVSLAALGLCSDPNFADESLSTNTLDATMYHYVQVGWRPQWNDLDIELTAGINNVFDEDPPACTSCSLNGYDPSVYEPQGQFGYIAASIKW